MPHGVRDQYIDAPSWTVEASTGKSGKQQFGNTLFGVSVAEATVTNGMGSPGWNVIKRGKGQYSSVTVIAGGSGYSNNDTFTVTAASGVNASGNVRTNGTGNVTNLIFSNTGGLFHASPNVVYTTSGVNANVRINIGGRAGRVQFETIVATKNITTDATSFTNTTNTTIANSTGTADDFILPDS